MKSFYYLAFAGLLAGAPPPVREIVERSAAAMEANWKAAPNYTYLERDVETKRGGNRTVKTYRVFMIEGTQYNRLIAVNDRVLAAQEAAREDQKLLAEIEKRKHETASARGKRIAKYARERQQDHAMMQEMVHAFEFKLVGEEKINGNEAWVLEAKPRAGYEPRTREARVLSGMQGKLWVDEARYQWIKVTAEVVRPVAMFLVAKVAPGTRFELQQAEVAEGVWLPVAFSVNVVASALGFINENSTDDESYSQYLPMPAESEMPAMKANP